MLLRTTALAATMGSWIWLLAPASAVNAGRSFYYPVDFRLRKESESGAAEFVGSIADPCGAFYGWH